MERKQIPGVTLASPAEVLKTKLSIWESRAKYATTKAAKAEAERAIADLTAKLAAVSA